MLILIGLQIPMEMRLHLSIGKSEHSVKNYYPSRFLLRLFPISSLLSSIRTREILHRYRYPVLVPTICVVRIITMLVFLHPAPTVRPSLSSPSPSAPVSLVSRLVVSNTPLYRVYRLKFFSLRFLSLSLCSRLVIRIRARNL